MNKLPRRYKLHILLILTGVILLAILPTSCTCNCSSNIGGGWRPNLLPNNYRIAFRSSREGSQGEDLYLIDSDGENLIKINDDPVFGSESKWSPDGTKIAFSTRGESSGIVDQTCTLHIADEDGNSIASIDDLPVISSDLHWSPDGTKIAFNYRNSEDRTYNICTIDSDGNNLTSLVTMQGRAADNFFWSPDGTKILFQSDRYLGDPDSLYVMDSNGSNLILLHDDDSSRFLRATWSPDSSKITYSVHYNDNDAGDIYVINSDGTGRVNITNGDYGRAIQSSWSSDGKKITFMSNISGDSSVHRVNADGTGITTLTFNGENMTWEYPSPDGSRILKATMPEGEEQGHFYITDANGKNPVRILENLMEALSGPRWAPDSRRLAYTTFNLDDNNTEDHYMHHLYVVNADGTGTMNLASFTVDMSNLSSGWFMWSPDGQKIIFTDMVDGGEDIFIIKADGTDLINLTDNPGRDWAPVLSR